MNGAVLAVVEYLDILADGGFGLDTGSVATMVYHFIFQASPKAFHRKVLMATKPGHCLDRQGDHCGDCVLRVEEGETDI